MDYKPRIREAIRKRAERQTTDQKVLAVLADLEGDEGLTVLELTRITGCSTTRVRQAVSDLAGAGTIVSTQTISTPPAHPSKLWRLARK